MGPQLYRCGNVVLQTAAVHQGQASMGPQLYRCGNETPGQARFNNYGTLQWGRNFIVAEIGKRAESQVRVKLLQWGRNFIVAEMAYITRPVDSANLLQWGRNFIVAEIVTEALGLIPRQLLQWGRNFIVAEICRTGDTSFIFTVASMGPQLYRCGNPAQSMPWYGKITALQWGRNFIVAEISPYTSKTQHISRFNGAATLSLRKFKTATVATPATGMLQWGRNFIVAEIYLSRLSNSINTLASMGPQLYRCGNPTRCCWAG